MNRGQILAFIQQICVWWLQGPRAIKEQGSTTEEVGHNVLRQKDRQPSGACLFGFDSCVLLSHCTNASSFLLIQYLPYVFAAFKLDYFHPKNV